MTDGDDSIEFAVAQTATKYARAVDRRDWTALGACFTENATVTYHGYNSYEGRDAVVEGCRRSLIRFIETRHLVGDREVSVNVDGTEATSRCDVIATHLRSEPLGQTSRFTLGGVYTDHLVLQDGEWLIRDRELDQQWTSGDANAMRRD